MITWSQDGSLPAQWFTISRHPSTFFVAADLWEPSSFSKAKQDPSWLDAMQEEYQALLENHTWDLVLPPLDCSIIGCKWVYKLKQNQMVRWIDLKPGWWHVATLSRRVLTMTKPLVLLSSLLPFVQFFLLLHLCSGLSANYMLKMLFSMVILMRKFTWFSHQVLLILSDLTMFADFITLYMV